MSSSELVDHRSVIYLQQIEIKTATRRRMRVRLQIDGQGVEVQRAEPSLTWLPSRRLEITDASTIEVNIKAGHKMGGFSIGNLEALVELSVQGAVEAFWKSEDAISRTITFDRQPTLVTFIFRPSPSSETIRAAVQELQHEREIYQTLTRDSTEHTFGLTLKNGAVLAEMNPIVQAAFSVAESAFEVLKGHRKGDEAIADLADSIGRILPFAQLVIEDSIYEETEVLERVVTRLCTLIGDTANFVYEYAQRSLTTKSMKSTISTSAATKAKALLGDFARLEKEFDRAANVIDLKMAKKNELFQLLNRLKPIEAASYQESHGCMPGTRTAVLDDLFNWASKPGSPNNQPNNSHAASMYWLHSSPGLGKTSVANSLCSGLHASNNLGGSFFCGSNDPTLHQPRRILPTLIFQLACIWGPYRKLVAQALQDDPQLNPESRSSEVLFSLLESVQKVPSRTLVLVVDALDECGDADTRKQLLTCLHETSSRVSWIKVIVTSRRKHDITNFFQQNHVIYRDLANDFRIDDDILLFTRRRMASIASRRRLPADWPGEEHLKQIVDRSGGLFIFVETICQLIDHPDPNPLLAEVLDRESGEANAALNKLYSTILSKAGRNMKEFQPFCRALVAVATYHPLPDEALASLIGLDPRNVRNFVDGLGSILYRDPSAHHGIRVPQPSVIEFLTGPSCPDEFRVVPSQANEELCLLCLRTMMKELKFNICQLESSCSSNAEVQNLAERVQGKISAALQYSCMYWACHLSATSEPVNREISVLLDGFFTAERPLYWIEVLSLMGKVSKGISALQQIKGCIKILETRHQELIIDTLHFLLAFSVPISLSTPHIYISGLPFSPTGSLLWKNASPGSPKLMNVYKGRSSEWPAPPETWVGPQRHIWSVAYSPDGLYIVSGSDDGTIQFWDATSGEAMGAPLRGHTGTVWSVAYSPDRRHIASGSRDNTIRIWDAGSRMAVHQPLKGHKGEVKCIAYSPDGRYIASGSDDQMVRIWDTEKGKTIGEPLSGHRGDVKCVAYSPDGRYIVSASRDKTARIWNATLGKAMDDPLRGHTGTVWSVAYSPDGRHIVSGSRDNTIRIWDAKSGMAMGGPLMGHTDTVFSVAYSPDGLHVVSGSDDSTIRFWNATSGEAMGDPLTGHTSTVWSVAYSQDSPHIVSGSGDGTVRIWETGIELVNDHRHASKHTPTAFTDSRNDDMVIPHPLSALSNAAIPRERLNSNGWVTGPEGLLFWVPEHCRYGLTHLPTVTICNTRCDRRVRIDFTDFRYGTSWTDIY